MGAIILDHLLSILKIIVSLIILLVACKGVIKRKPFTSFIIVLSTLSFLIASVISFNLLLAKYIIYLFYGLSISYIAYSHFKARANILKTIMPYRRFIFSVLIIGLVSLVYMLFNLNIAFMYNGHDPYFYGIPYEIIEGNYSARIKIWDNYPVTWSKYHFFPGSFASIFLLTAGLKNIFLFKFYKLLVVVIMFFVFDENLNSTIKSQFYKTLIFSLPISVWLINTNGALPLLFLVLSFSFYIDKKTDYSILFLLFFASSLSRHVLPGLMLFVVISFFRYKSLINSKIVYIFIFPVLNIITMIFTGFNPVKMDLSYYFNGDFLYNFFYGLGGSFLFQNVLYNLYDVSIVSKASIHSFIYFMPLLFFLLLLKKHKNSLIVILPSIIIFTSILIQALIKFEASINSYNIIDYFLKGLYIVNALITFCYQFYIINRYYQKKHHSILIILFFVLSILNMIIIPSSGPPIHYYFTDLIVIFILCKEIYFFKIKPELIMATIIVFILIPLNSSQHYIAPPKQYSIIKKIDKTPLDYKKIENRDEIILKSNIYGLRINYYKQSEEAYHLSKQFLSPYKQ